ncbi:glycosyltransferase family 2 protein (plasmid) [Pedobacter sp. BS3]|uniref:glycosyltransferase family 2 protein n=1 Tax=Pedobacter sp. BS3 TaxID=2567937 RepID=UPI0011EC6390|nr:glycosyltransferase family 2 protein [Pedobacter sp. BS3]TZF86452.1 glycosyltransferase family 2 protein [Pedobacter sp. BS3]
MSNIGGSASIVLFKNETKVVQNTILRVIESQFLQVYLIDNSPTDVLKNISKDSGVIYIHNSSNLGFGAAHNIAIRKAMEDGLKYHFIINPDIEIKEDVFTPMIEYMEANPDVGMMMPKVLNGDGSVQNLPKLLPHPAWIFRRKLKKMDPFSETFINKYELRKVPYSLIYNVPILSGCFTLLRLDAIKEVGKFDEKFFMYFEDFDLSRRMHKKYKTIYFPKVSVYHGYEGGANKSWKLFKIYIKSMITYFNKWGWFFDKERKKFNKETLAQFK